MTSIMEQLREKRRAAAAITTIDLAIPGYDGQLVARYRLIDPLTDGKEIADRVQRQFKEDHERLFYSFVDTLVVACDAMLFRDADGKLAVIDPDDLGAMTYDERLASFLGIESTDARSALLGVFGGNRTAVMAHHTTFMRWMEDPAGNTQLGEA